MKPFNAFILPVNTPFCTLASPFLSTVAKAMQLKKDFTKAQRLEFSVQNKSTKWLQ